jgi:hypothetical protein
MPKEMECVMLFQLQIGVTQIPSQLSESWLGSARKTVRASQVIGGGRDQ